MKKIAIFLIFLYQKTLSKILHFLGVRCRFYPTCSEYSMEAFKKHGFLRGFWLSFKRLIKCHPWGGSGIDNIPQ